MADAYATVANGGVHYDPECIISIEDKNGNGKWDTGEYAADRQAETTYYYPEKIECKAKWDLNLTWNPTARSLEKQKPMEITKQKPEQERP